jgi:hypothetical protein
MKKPANVVESKQQQAEVAAAQVVMAKAAKVRAEQALEQDDVAVQAAVEATSEEAQAQAAVAEDTGSATLADAAFVLGEAGAAVQSNSLFSSPLAYVGGAFGSSLIGGAGSAASVGASALSSAAAGAASVASVDDERVSIVSVESSDEAADASADDTPAPVFAPVVEQAPVAASDVSMGQIATVDNSEADAGVAQRARLKIDGVMDNSGTMRVMYGDGAALGDTTPVITGVAAANQRIVIRDKASNTTLGLTTSDANGNWSFELPTRSSGQHEVTVQTISMDREEASFAFRVSEASGATASTASNALVAATGTEDTAYVFGATDIANLRSGTNINIITEILVNSLPADGALQFRANNTWTPVTVGQSISNADIRGGNLRFVPDANESGSAAYNNAGVGNQRNLYTEFDLKVVGASAATSEGDVTFQLSIAPEVDNTQTISGVADRVGQIAALSATGEWSRYTFTVSGNINDTDGSERSRILITPSNTQTTFAVLQNGQYSTPSLVNGQLVLEPGQQLLVRDYAQGSVLGSSISYKLVGQEVNSSGAVLASKDLSTDANLRTQAAPIEWQRTGTEDTNYVFGASDVSNLTAQMSIGTLSHFTVNRLPADGALQVQSGTGQWTAVTVGQRIDGQDVINGRLRFVPDANESGSAAYRSAGVGNQRNIYAEVDLRAVGDNNAIADVKLQMSINPVVDNVLTLSDVAVTRGWITALGTTTSARWHTWTVNGSGRTDTDGSEVELVAVRAWRSEAGSPIGLVNSNGSFTRLTPDSQGWVFIQPGQSIIVRAAGDTNGWGITGVEYRGVFREVNALGDVIAERTTGIVRKSYSHPSPLILDLDGNGVQTTTLENGVNFDLNDDGLAHQVAWTDGVDGFLVLDRNGDGIISSGAELFGDHTVMASGQVARDGFEALRDLDSNADGVFNAQDDLFQQVQVWVDANHDGISGADELFGLEQLGIAEIQLNPESTPDRFENDNFYGLTSSFTWADGRTSEVVDVWLNATSDENHRYVSQLVI